MTLWKMGVLTYDSPWVYYSFYIGMMVEAVLFSFALADRIRVYRWEAQEAQSLAMQRLQENEHMLLSHTQTLEQNLRLEQAGQQQPIVEEFIKRIQQERTKIRRLSVSTSCYYLCRILSGSKPWVVIVRST